MEKNVYAPIESDVVRSFNESCFDYIGDACIAENGDIALMPVSNYVLGIVYQNNIFAGCLKTIWASALLSIS